MTAVDREALREALVASMSQLMISRPGPWQIADALLAGPLAPLLADAGLRTRVEELAARYDTEHADWCCTKGCVQGGQHLPDEAVPALLDAMAAHAVPAPVALVPCPKTCTCHIGPQIADLRAVLDPPTPTTGATS